jgi:hypothetical protein
MVMQEEGIVAMVGVKVVEEGEAVGG